MLLLFAFVVGLVVGTFAKRALGPGVGRSACVFAAIGGAMAGGIVLGVFSSQGVTLGPAGLLGAIGGAWLASLVAPRFSTTGRPGPNEKGWFIPRP